MTRSSSHPPRSGPVRGRSTSPIQGNRIRQFAPTPTAAATFDGYLDGASDRVGTLIWVHEDGIEFTDTNGNPVTTVQAANGPQTVATIPRTGFLASVFRFFRGIAYDPDGNGGSGSLFLSNSTLSILETDLQGGPLRIFGNLGFWDAAGLALLPNGDLLINGRGEDGPVLSIDRQTALPTGLSLDVDRKGLTGAGCEVIQNPRGPQTLIVSVNFDERRTGEVAIYQFERFAGVDESGISLEQRINAEPYQRSWTPLFPSTTTLSLRLNAPTTAPGLVFLNFGSGVDVCADNTVLGTPFEGLNDLWAATLFSNPLDIPIEIPMSGNSSVDLSVAPILALTGRADFRAQAVVGVSGVPAPYLPFVPTNEVRFGAYPNAVGVIAAADGENVNNADPTSGFWSVKNSSTDPNKAITSVVFDWTMAGNFPNFSAQEFRTNIRYPTGNFQNGNSALATCPNAYRNGSDITTGLVYDAMNTSGVRPCDPTSNTGWIGTNWFINDEYGTLEWRFAGGLFRDGAMFEFDVLTDTRRAESGDEMAGMIVVVTFADGTVVAGELGALPGTNRSEVVF